ncbi:MAG: HAD family hydrolase [Thermoleophilaceae bacterium]
MRAVLFDALGTLVRLEPPAPRLRQALGCHAGIDVGEEAAARGFEAEISFYLANHMRGGDAEGLERLRDDCAEVLHVALGVEGLSRPAVRAAMLESLNFTAFNDVAPALRDLRGRGLKIVVVSNWDRSLPRALASAGIAELVDATVSSAEVGAAKPDPAPVLAGLELAGVEPWDALLVGDSPESDLPAAHGAGVRAVLISREEPRTAGPESVTSLDEIASLL